MKTLKPFLFVAAVAAVLSACQQQTTNDTQATADKPVLQGIIRDTTAKRLVKNFDARAYHNPNHKLAPDTRCIWFSKEQLKALIDTVYKENGDGIRFYFAAYDKDQKPDLKRIDSTYRDYTTLVMVSTRASGTLHIDYYKSLIGADPNYKNKGEIITAVPENTGEICPPPVKCNLNGATLLTDK